MRVICSKHPRYLGKRKPTSNCICCNKMWEMINHKRGYTSLFGYDDHSTMRIIAEPNKKIKCKYCSEPFTPIHREHICMECKYDQDIFREELRESKQQK